ncbi:MAG: hypothetical protein M3P89_05470 [Actinomycetota bacterium]|nr:hypothetical protein [Actinomycetota bacterium]
MTPFVLEGDLAARRLGTVDVDEAVSDELTAFARLLERGAGHLAAARAAHLRQCREAAELARAGRLWMSGLRRPRPGRPVRRC